MAGRLGVPKQHEDGDACREFSLAVLARDPDEGAAIAPRAVRTLPAEQRPDDVVFFPRLEDERLAGPFALAENQMLGEKPRGLGRGALIVPIGPVPPSNAVEPGVRVCLKCLWRSQTVQEE